MRTFARLSFVIAILTVGSLHATAVNAAAVILVGVFGVDNATCGPVQPCRTLQHAINRAAPGDVIYLGNPVDYSPATIAKAITITTGGTGAGVYSPSGGPCLTINGAATDDISISGFTCDQGGAANHGILFNSGRTLSLTDVDLRRGGGTACAIRFQPNANAALNITDITATTWSRGVCLAPRSAADASGVISNARLQNNAIGILSTGDADSAVKVLCAECSIVTGGTGIHSSGALSILRIRDNRISGNTTGLSHPTNGKIVSHGGNSVTGNTTNGTVTSTVPP